MNKKFLLTFKMMVFAIAIACVSPLHFAKAAADSTLSFNAASVSILNGQGFSLDAMINPGTNSVSAVTLHITYDQTKIALDSITPSSTFSLVLLASSINNTNGTASMDLGIPTTSPSVATTSPVATFAFHAIAPGVAQPIVFTTASMAAADGETGNVITTRTGASVTVTSGSPSTYTIGGSISGLNGTVVLQNNAGDNLSTSSNGSFTFATALNDSSNYVVSVLTQPSGQTCSVTSGSGAISGANVTNVAVNCLTNDVIAPVVTAITVPPTSSSSTIPISSLTATDNVGVTAWIIEETTTNSAPAAPSPSDSGWQTTGISGTTSATITGNVTIPTSGTWYLWAFTKDAAGNVSAAGTSQQVVATLPPVVSGGSPSGTLAAGTTQATVSVTTDDNATCKYATASGTSYALMSNVFTTTGTTTHSFTATGLVDGSSYGYFVRCQDTNGNSDQVDYLVSFSVATPGSAPVVTPIVAPTQASSDDSSSSKDDTPSPRSIYDSRSKLDRGMMLTQRGKKFSKSSIIDLYFSKYGGGFYAPVPIKTTSSGNFLLRYAVNKPKGTYGWYALDTKTNKKSRTIYYKVRK